MDDTQSSIIKKLLERMDNSPGFAGLGASVQTISKLGDEDSDNKDITTVILRDAALTSKLLRLSNSSQRGGRNISTIDQAIAILGLNTVKSVALSLALLDSLGNKPQSKQLHAEIVAAYFCGTLSFEITRLYAVRFNPQVAQIGGLMQNIGRMMAVYYLYEDIERSHTVQIEKNLSEADAILQTLGVRFDDISLAIAQHWSLPDVLQKSLTPDTSKAPPRAVTDILNWQQLCPLFARQITDILFRTPENREKVDIKQVIDYFHTALFLRADETQERIEKVLVDTDLLLTEIGFPCNVQDARNQLRKGSERVLDMLKSGDSLTKTQEEAGHSPLEIIQRMLHQIHHHFGFDRTLLCLPQGSSGLVAIAGVGRNANAIVPKFRCYSAQPDIFRLGLAKKMDLVVADTRNPNYVKLMPNWYQEVVGAHAFVMLPLLHKDHTLGMLYGDFTHPLTQSPLKPGDTQLADWRNQLIKALLAGAAKH